MFKKKSLLILYVLLALGIVVNSCKKERQSNIPSLLTASPWTLASVEVTTYVGSVQVGLPATLNTDCNLKQTFTFKTDQSCTYQNFICKEGSASGTWALSPDLLTLQSGMMCKDTVAGGRDTTDAPFQQAQIVNLGSYSLVLQTGNIYTNSTSTPKRVIKRYSFIHQD